MACRCCTAAIGLRARLVAWRLWVIGERLVKSSTDAVVLGLYDHCIGGLWDDAAGWEVGKV